MSKSKTVHVLLVTKFNNMTRVFKIYSEKPSVEQVIKDLSGECEWEERSLVSDRQVYYKHAPYELDDDRYAIISERTVE